MLEILGFGVQVPLIAFSAVGVDSRSSIFGVDSTAAAVAGPVDINAMMARGGDDDDTAAAGAAAPWPPPAPRPPVPATAAEAEAD